LDDIGEILDGAIISNRAGGYNEMSERNPWKRLDSRTVYTNPWMTVREDRVIRPDGKEGIYGVVQTRIATGVVAITPQLEVVLVGQYRYPTDVYSWEIVQGGTDEGEEPLTACKRELQEEAGLIAVSWSPLGGEVHLSNCISSEIGFIYLAEGLTHTEAAPDGTEVLRLMSVPLREAVRMATNGEIVDAVSIIGILLAERRLVSEGRL
jgi:8-oxo-dGTP pyrophosphatase MutT (NUDIX family)